MKAIINADDFGINEVVTHEIERLIEIGAVSSTTIMANGQCLEEVKRFTLCHPEISFGAHLCLTEFGCITQSKILKNYGIIDENGNFIHKQILRQKSFNADLKKAIQEELNAQIDVIKALGIVPSHADSHHHVHTIYPLREVFKEVLKKQGINKIRIGSPYNTLRLRRHLLLWYQRNKLNDYYRSNFVTTDMFLSYGEFFNKYDYSSNCQIVELMCHPGHPGFDYKEEAYLVENKALKEMKDYKLISYNELF